MFYLLHNLHLPTSIDRHQSKTHAFNGLYNFSAQSSYVTFSTRMPLRTLRIHDWEHKAKAATEQSLQWSADEQGAAAIDVATEDKLVAANKEYEQKFGRIFIVCATGKTAAEMLAILKTRLSNDAATELKEAAEQQRQITQLRLRKWLHIS